MNKTRNSLAGVVVAGFIVACAAVARAEVKLGMPFTDHMVLQRGMPIPVLGEASAGEKVTVEFAGQTKSSSAEKNGKWTMKLDAIDASAEPRTMTVRGDNTIVLNDVLVGEVWLCSGQSNMDVSLTRIKTAGFASDNERAHAVERVDKELATTTPGIRLFHTATSTTQPWQNSWMQCGPEALKDHTPQPGFSAVGYFFGKELRDELKVPIGLMQSSVGGTRIESWTPPQAYAALPAFRTEATSQPVKIDGANPGKNFHALIQPLAPYALRGVLWYQGESNLIECNEDARYADKMEALIQSWRGYWMREDLPFYYVQLPAMAYSKRRSKVSLTALSLPRFREGQAMALRIPRTGMVITSDLTSGYNLHPGNKWDVAHRIALLALAQCYGRHDIECSGPVFKSMRKQDHQLVLSFDHAAGGLISRDGKPLTDFTIAGEDRQFVPADAVVDGETIIVSSPQIAHPTAARFAWHELAIPNLINKAGLPAAQFRTDDWPVEALSN